MGEKEQGIATAREDGSVKATGQVFPETNVAQTDPEGGGIAIDEEGVQRTGQPLGSAAYARGAGPDADPGPAAATNLNSSRSNIYRTGGGAPATEDEASEEPIPGKPSKEQRGGGGGVPAEATNLNSSKSNVSRTTMGDPDLDLAAQKKMPERDRDASQ